jgi:tetratricopeptide (TPR) repeat protein
MTLHSVPGRSRFGSIPTLVTLAAAATLVAAAAGCARNAPAPTERAVPLMGSAGAATTDRDSLQRTISGAEHTLATKPGDVKASVTLADALLRQTRVTGNAGLATRAETVLRAALNVHPDNYDVGRMLATVYLSQHRFRDALAEANGLQMSHATDAWLYGVIGDARLEIGDYDEAFAAFDRMVTLRPNAASYARESYARELSGDLTGALQLMQMATAATSPQDPESLAWHHAELGHLDFELGHLDDARREYAHAEYAFPGHPFATDGLAHVLAAQGNYQGALDRLAPALSMSPTPADLAFAGDLLTALGRPDEAQRDYRLAEAAWQSDAPEPSRLARFLSEHGRRLPDVISIATQIRPDRHDIFTSDALAWAYFQTGQMDRAAAAITDALRTGSRDREIRYHAAAIAQARGHLAEARGFAADAVAGLPTFDLVTAPAARALNRDLGARQTASLDQ